MILFNSSLLLQFGNAQGCFTDVRLESIRKLSLVVKIVMEDQNSCIVDAVEFIFSISHTKANIDFKFVSFLAILRNYHRYMCQIHTPCI